MINTNLSIRNFYFLLLTIKAINFVSGQEENDAPVYKNQIATNLGLWFFNSIDLSYERIGCKQMGIWGLRGTLRRLN